MKRWILIILFITITGGFVNQSEEDYCQSGACSTNWSNCGFYQCDIFLWETIWCLSPQSGFCDAPYPPGGSGMCPQHYCSGFHCAASSWTGCYREEGCMVGLCYCPSPGS